MSPCQHASCYRHAVSAMPRATAAEALAHYCRDANLIGTWHGHGVDLPELDKLFDESGVTAPTATAIDVAYLAYCCWPLAASHELGRIATHAWIDTSAVVAHDAGDDATLTVQVLNAVAQVVRGWTTN